MRCASGGGLSRFWTEPCPPPPTQKRGHQQQPQHRQRCLSRSSLPGATARTGATSLARKAVPTTMCPTQLRPAWLGACKHCLAPPVSTCGGHNADALPRPQVHALWYLNLTTSRTGSRRPQARQDPPCPLLEDALSNAFYPKTSPRAP
eukprot:gene9495-biopygen16728